MPSTRNSINSNISSNVEDNNYVNGKINKEVNDENLIYTVFDNMKSKKTNKSLCKYFGCFSWQKKALYNPRKYYENRLLYSANCFRFINAWNFIIPYIKQEDNMSVWGFSIGPFKYHSQVLDLYMFKKIIRSYGLNYFREIVGADSSENVRKNSSFYNLMQENKDQFSVDTKTKIFPERKETFKLYSAFSELEINSVENPLKFNYDEEIPVFNFYFGRPRIIKKSGGKLKSIEREPDILKQLVAESYFSAISTDEMAIDGDTELLIFFGGKDMLTLDFLPMINRFYNYLVARNTNNNGICEIKYHIFLNDYPSYGSNNGELNVENMEQQSIKIIDDLLCEKKINMNSDRETPVNYNIFEAETRPCTRVDSERMNRVYKKINILGYSLGTCVALQAAIHVAKNYSQYPCNLVLVSPPSLLNECVLDILKAPKSFRPLGLRFLSMIESKGIVWNNVNAMNILINQILENNIEYVKNLNISIIHGLMDSVVKYRYGYSLYILAKRILNEKLQMNTNDSDEINKISTLKQKIEFIPIFKAGHTNIIVKNEYNQIIFDQILKN